MSIHFGSIHYFSDDLSERPGVVVEALRGLLANGERVVFRGSFANSDKWSRRQPVSDRSLDQLTADVAGNVYGQVVGYRGERNRETVTLAIDCLREGKRGAFPLTAMLMLEVPDESFLPGAEVHAHRLWALLKPSYGVVAIGDSPLDVQSEITTIPTALWGCPDDIGNQKRLELLQSLRPLFGAYTRDAEWGNYLGPALVEVLGGLDHVMNRAPANHVEALPDAGGVYLRLSEHPRRMTSSEYRTAIARLNAFLLPAMVPELRQRVQ